MLRNFGGPELLILLVIVVLIFGTSKLTGVGSTLGNSIKEFRKAVRDEDVAEPTPAPEGEGKETAQP